MKFHILLAALLIIALNSLTQQNKPDSIKEDFKDDWAALSHCKTVNKQLAQPKPGEKRVVFLGRAELTTDGVHPNLAGYKIMAKVTEVAIAKALK